MFQPASSPVSEAAFLALADEAWEELPELFRAVCTNVSIHVTDFADPETLRHFGMTNPWQISGLYQGVDMTRRSITHPSIGPDYVFLYRLPILREWQERGDITLKELITHVLVHEIGHHFGFSDDDMHELQEED